MTGRHVGAVDAAEGTVWAESIRTRALVAANAVEAQFGAELRCPCDFHQAMFAAVELLTEIAGAP